MKQSLQSCIKIYTYKRFIWLLLLALGLVVLFALLSLSVGSTRIPFHDITHYFFTSNISDIHAQIIHLVRLPRTIAALTCGGCLAVAGLLLQAALNNALASAGTIGVNSGAGLFVVIGAILFPYSVFTRSIFVLIGALSATFLVYFIARVTRASATTIVMAGIAVSSLLSAMSDALVTIFPDQIMDKTSFFIGGFTSVNSSTLLSISVLSLLVICVVIFLGTSMNVLSLGDEVASTLGLHVKAYRFLLLFLAALLASFAISIGGVLGFVGLIIPHMMRFIIGHDYRYLVIMSMLGGMILVLVCDILSRVLFAPYEIPVGILLSFIGAPFFLFLIVKKYKRVNT